MKFLYTLIMATLLLTGSGFAQDFGFSVGPFSLLFNTGFLQQRPLLHDPICNAISHQQRLEMLVEGKETVSAKEMKIVTKKLTVEPYAFGITKEGKPILRGNVIEEKQLREIRIKYEDDKFDTASEKEKSFSGWFSSGKDKNIDIRKVSDLHVVEDSHFDVPKDYQPIKDEDIHVICQLPVLDEK
jgi:hypothetical protein